MRHAMLGTGMVGKAIGERLIELGDEVCMGSRTPDNEVAAAWAEAQGDRASLATFQDAVAGADFVWLAVKGEHALEVLASVGDVLEGKTVLDLTNPLDFSQGFPPRLFVCNDDSLGEQLQRAHPDADIVKTFNTLSHVLMVNPGALPEEHDVFVAGESETAKEQVSTLIERLGHKTPLDLGGIEASRGLEAWLLLWTRLYGVIGTPFYNLRLVRAEA